MKTNQPKSLLPPPMELAKLAAMLRPSAKAGEALKAAMELYLEAVLFVDRLPAGNAELLEMFESYDRRNAQRLKKIGEMFEAIEKGRLTDSLELNMAANDDPVRQYLAAKGLVLKNSRAVVENIDNWYEDLVKAQAQVRGRPKDLNCIVNERKDGNGQRILAIPRSVLDDIATQAAERRKESKRKAWKTRKARSAGNSAS